MCSLHSLHRKPRNLTVSRFIREHDLSVEVDETVFCDILKHRSNVVCLQNLGHPIVRLQNL